MSELLVDKSLSEVNLNMTTSFTDLRKSISKSEIKGLKKLSTREKRAKASQKEESKEEQQEKMPSLREFKMIENIGTGSYGKVYLVEREGGKRYAMKQLNKEQITKVRI